MTPIQLAVLLSTLPPTDPWVVAARVGLEVGELRADASLVADDYAGGRFHRQHVLAEHTELQIHRYPPTGDRELWVRYGPAGPPLVAVETEAA